MTALTARMTPADEGIAKAREDAKALDRDGFPSWEKIAKVHRKASEARLEKIKEQDHQIQSLRSQLKEAREEIVNLTIDMHNEGMEGY